MKKTKEKKTLMKRVNNKKKYMFCTFLYLNVFCKAIGLGNESKFYFVLLLFSVVVLFFKIIDEKYTKKELLLCFSFLLIAFLTFIVTGKPTLLLTMLCITSMKNVDVEKIFKGMFNIRCVCFIIVVSLAFIGILPNLEISMWRSGSYVTRYSLGYGHPNNLHLSLFILISLYLYNKNETIGIVDFLIVIVSNCFIYSYSKSRTAFLLIFLMSILFWICSKYKNSKKINNFLNKTALNCLVLLICLSFGTALMYSPDNWIRHVDSLLNGRVAYTKYYLNNYEMTFFGTKEILIDDNALFDNGYVFLYSQYGLFGFLLIIYILYNIIKNDKVRYDIKKNILIICYLIYIFIESFSPNVFMNIILLFSSLFIFEKREDVNEDNCINSDIQQSTYFRKIV